MDEKYSQSNTLVLVSTGVPTFPVSLAPGKGTEAIFELSRLFSKESLLFPLLVIGHQEEGS